jgi:hypothetical protein
MTKQITESQFEDLLHRIARKVSKHGLSVKAIGDSFADRARFARYIETRAEWPIVVSAETSARRREQRAA